MINLITIGLPIPQEKLHGPMPTKNARGLVWMTSIAILAYTAAVALSATRS